VSQSSGSQFIICEVRPEHIGMVAGVHREAFGDSFLTMLGRGAVRRYYELLRNGPYEQSSFVALSEGKVVGFCFSGIFTGATSTYLKKHLLYVSAMVMIRPGLVFNSLFFRRVKTGLSLLMPAKRPGAGKADKDVAEWRILAIAVSPGCQGSGAAKMLMDISERSAREKGHKRIGLTVKNDNSRAIRFYEKLGYAGVSTSGDGEYLSMEKGL